MKFTYILTFFAVALLLTACQPQKNVAPNVSIEGAIITTGNETVNQTAELTSQAEEQNFENATYTITAIEGDLVKLSLKAVDPDGDKLDYDYSKPFSDNGLWQTKDGDAGKYLIKVTASDAELSSTTDVLVIINPSNKAPIIDCMDGLTLKEGETVELKCNFFDKENDPLTIEYSGWMSSTKYTTNFESAGSHKVFVKASDGNQVVTKTIEINVDNVDRAPIFDEKLKDMTVIETDIVTLKPSVTDPDDDSVKLTYSEPFDSKGTWKTEVGDAGTYPVSIVASDGTLTTKETFTLTVKMLNTAPVMSQIPNITVHEGETITIKPQIADREDDAVVASYSGWMGASAYKTTYDDAYPNGCSTNGCSVTHKVTVTATDGQYQVSQDVYVTIVDRNRPPEFVYP